MHAQCASLSHTFWRDELSESAVGHKETRTPGSAGLLAMADNQKQKQAARKGSTQQPQQAWGWFQGTLKQAGTHAQTKAINQSGSAPLPRSTRLVPSGRMCCLSVPLDTNSYTRICSSFSSQ